MPKLLTQEQIILHSVSKDGFPFDVINYENCRNVTVKFEDGTTRKLTYEQIRKGFYKLDPKSKLTSRIGETRVMNNGLKATISEYIKSAHIYVTFENGLKQRATYEKFINGTLTGNTRTSFSTNESRIGQRKKMNCGEICEVIKSDSYTDIYVKFLKSKVIKHATWSSFLSGKISNEAKTNITNFIGKTFFNKTCGLSYTIVEKSNKKSMCTIKFEDGTTKDVEYKSAINSNSIHPSFFKNGKMNNFYGYNGIRKKINNRYYWEVEGIGLTIPQQILKETR